MDQKKSVAAEQDMVKQIIEHLVSHQEQIQEIVVAHVTDEGNCFLSLSCSSDLLKNMMGYILQDEPPDIKIPDHLNQLNG